MKALRMKEWIANKKAQEFKINLYTDEIFAVLKETEKAIYAMISLGQGRHKCTWLPKSAVEECEPANKDFATRYGLTYEEAALELKVESSFY